MKFTQIQLLLAIASLVSATASSPAVDVPGTVFMPMSEEGTKELVVVPGSEGALAKRVPSLAHFDYSKLRWWVTLSVGTPGQPAKVLLDTGSFNLYVPSATARTEKKKLECFDSEKSTTWKRK